MKMLPPFSSMYAYNILINLIVKRYLNDDNCIMQVGMHIAHIDQTPAYIVNDYWDTFTDKPCQIFLIDGPDAFEYIEKHVIRRNLWSRYNKRKFIIVTERLFTSKVFKHVADVIFLKRVKSTTEHYERDVRVKSVKIHNGNNETEQFDTNGNTIGIEDNDVEENIRIKNDQSEYYEIYGKHFVDNELYLLDVWYAANGSFMKEQQQRNELFPDRLLKLQGMTLKVGTFTYIPYSNIELNRGFELECIQEFAKSLELNVEVADAGDWGQIHDDDRGDGILGGVLNDIYDIGFSSLFSLYRRHHLMDFTVPTTLSQITCLVPAPTPIIGSQNNLRFFTIVTWCCIMGTYLIMIIINKVTNVIAKKFQRISLNTFALTSVYFQQSLPSRHILHSSLSSRILLLCALIYSYLTTVAYSTRLASLIVVPMYSNEINTVGDLAKSNLTWVERNVGLSLPLEWDTKEVSRLLFHKFQVKTMKEMEQLAFTGKYAFGMERCSSGYYAVGTYIAPETIHYYKVMNENLYNYYIVMYLRQNSVYLDKLNKFIHTCTEAGLMKYWELQATMALTNNKIQNYLKYSQKDQYFQKRLQIQNLTSAFSVLLLGSFISFCVLFVELYVRKFHK